MAKYVISKIEHHKVDIIRSQTFDTSDQNAWEKFRELAQYNLGDRIDEFPKKAPKNVDIWFDLLSWVSNSEYEDEKEDWWTFNKGGYQVTITLQDEKGKEVKLKQD
ncbi:hypothetical protein AOB54_02915 [beta proteobacterium MWH-UniP1]